MEYEGFVEHVRLDGDRLVAVADGDLATSVPSCPGWTVRDLVAHIAQVYEHKIECTRLGHAPEPWPPEWPGADQPVDWYRDAHGRLLAMFDENDATSPSATWWPADQTVGFWARRMAHETAVHRVDAELARGVETPIDAELATDGVDELLRIMLEGDWSDDADDAATGQRVAIETGGRVWDVVLDRGAMTVSDGGGSSDARLGGAPSDVLLWLWGRAGDDRVTYEGDAETYRVLRERLTMATQ
jgi:uncharacterized protein (TIGR03083 family)